MSTEIKIHPPRMIQVIQSKIESAEGVLTQHFSVDGQLIMEVKKVRQQPAKPAGKAEPAAVQAPSAAPVLRVATPEPAAAPAQAPAQTEPAPVQAAAPSDVVG